MKYDRHYLNTKKQRTKDNKKIRKSHNKSYKL